MQAIAEMLATHPRGGDRLHAALTNCIEECYACAQACTACADACLAETTVDQLSDCIRRNLDCADICLATGAVALRLTGANGQVIAATLDACAIACRSCGEECERHAGHHQHCRICAEACRTCEAACREALRAFH